MESLGIGKAVALELAPLIQTRVLLELAERFITLELVIIPQGVGVALEVSLIVLIHLQYGTLIQTGIVMVMRIPQLVLVKLLMDT